MLEEPDDEDPDAEGVFQGIAGKNRMLAWGSKRFRERGTEMGIGRRMEGLLRETGALDTVDAVKLAMPLNGRHESKYLSSYPYPEWILTVSMP